MSVYGSAGQKSLLTAVESLIVHKPFYKGAFSSELNCILTGNRGPNQLSHREALIVKLVADGYSNKGHQRKQPRGAAVASHSNAVDTPAALAAAQSLGNIETGIIRRPSWIYGCIDGALGRAKFR